ncbi:MAG: primosomal protein N' [Betaproteobacteria bacterium]|jgi:primosomal protein N' (replication factor Y)
MTIFRIALDVPVHELFDYQVPSGGDEDIGRLAVVPFGKGARIGVIVEVVETSAFDPSRLKAPRRLLAHLPKLPPQSLSLAAFCSRYYQYPLGATIHTGLPTALRRVTLQKIIRPVSYGITIDGASVDAASLDRRATAQRQLLLAFQVSKVLDSIAIASVGPSAKALIPTFVSKGWISPTDGEPVPAWTSVVEEGPPLTEGQWGAISEITSHTSGFACHLLHGITGSGKTEVYLRLIAWALTLGRQALLLVPEINLTPQLEARVAARFGSECLVTLHSGQSEGERMRNWIRSTQGAASVVLGTRLAVFTPIPNLGVIIVDEEHDSSYKQQEGLRYHARDVAVFRARELGIPVVLGSATPSLESWRHAQEGRYRLLSLPTRPGRPTPEIFLVKPGEGSSTDGISTRLADSIGAALTRREQVLIFLNRRGYAPALFCYSCGWVAQCPRCTARLTLHLATKRLRCHYCGHEERTAERCVQCGNQDLLPIGQGTQRLEEALARRFPSARIARVDRDSTRRKHAFADLRERVVSQQVDLLIGTQMLAKGHDFPRLTLVGILGADAALLSSDFRAEERLFSLLLQVSGRAGRADLPGQVLVQTALPDHPLYKFLLSQDFVAFASHQLALRRRTAFPPYSHQVLLRAEALEQDTVFDFLGLAIEAAGPLVSDSGVTVYAPVPATPARLAGRWRAHLMIQSESRPALQRFLRAWRPLLQSHRVRWAIDVDPVDL